MADKPRIVSSSHLVSERAAELSELEFALILSGNAFNRWMVRCMRAAGMPDVSVLDILVLHNVNSREREKKSFGSVLCAQCRRQPSCELIA